eukprot:3054897-Prymnesium_polylepis.1
MSAHIDLRLFEQLDELVPPDFVLSRAQPMPQRLRESLREHCVQHERSLAGAARVMCAEEKGSPLAERTGAVVVSNATKSKKRCKPCTCIRPDPDPTNVLGWFPAHRCGGGHHGDDGSFCWQHCCRGNLMPNRKQCRLI